MRVIMILETQHTVNADNASDNTKQDHMLEDTNIKSKNVELNEEESKLETNQHTD